MSAPAIRPVPYPYRAMLAIASDLDLTPDRHAYFESMRFLNTTADTASGPGVGLEVGNSIYFDMPPGQFAYWTTDEAGREMVRRMIRSGHVDCLHSFGDLATTRGHAGRALDELARHGCRLRVWVDHAVAPSNFGADIMRGHGDVPGSPVYHADLTCGAGVEFVWRGRVTSVVGQDVPRRLSGIGDRAHAAASLRAAAKEGVKGLLARAGHAKYAMHGPNRLTRSATLRDGRPVVEFIRSNPHWGGVSRGETGDGLGEVLTTAMLDTLVARGGVTVLYTHLGKVADRRAPFPPATCEGLRRLAAYEERGAVLVATTARLLAYRRSAEAARATLAAAGDGAEVDLRVGGAWAPEDLDGLTVYVDDPARTRLRVDGREVPSVRRNPPDHTGRASLSVPWRRLEFPS
jgi:hypothetical protein